MSFQNIPTNGAIRLCSKSDVVLTHRMPVAKLPPNTSPQEYVNSLLKDRDMQEGMVEVMKKAGNSFISAFKFPYKLTAENLNYTDNMKGVPLSGTHDGMIYTGHEGFLAKQYEKWYQEEAEKNRNLRIELDHTQRELNKATNELQLLSIRTELDNKSKDIDRKYSDKEKELDREREELARERAAQSGLGGLMETLEKNTFLQGLLEKVVDNFTRAKEGMGGVPKVDDPTVQQALTEAMNVLVKLSEDKEHFSYCTLMLDKAAGNKGMARQVFAWMNTPKPEKPDPKQTINQQQ